jgi:hypothetical protein
MIEDGGLKSKEAGSRKKGVAAKTRKVGRPKGSKKDKKGGIHHVNEGMLRGTERSLMWS